MIEFRQFILLSLGAASFSILSACGGSGSDGAAEVSTTRFDGAVDIPPEAMSLGKRAAAPLLYAIQTQGFETEYDKEQIYAPHKNAWERWDLYDYVYDGTYTDVRQCADIAGYQSGFSGRGTVTIVNTLQDNYVGYVEHRYDGCVIGDRAYSGTRRIKVLEEPRDHPSGRPAARFKWEYEDFYWGTGGLNYYLNGTIGFEELGETENYNYPYRSTSNYTFSRRDGYSYSMRDLFTQCSDDRNELSGNDHSWRCAIQSGYVGLDGLGEFSVETLQPVHQSVWLWGAKLQVSDSDGNHLVFWGDEGQKRVTLVDAEAREKTYAMDYGSADMTGLDDSRIQPIDPATEAIDTRFMQWEKGLYASDTDEFIFFDRRDARYVDTIRPVEGAQSIERRIDLVEPAYDVNVLFEGDAIVSGHDGATRSIYLKDPELGSSHRAIGLGKIVEVYDDRVVTYQVPGSYEQERISYQWDYSNQVITSTRRLGYSYDAFAYKNGQFAVGDWNSVELRSDQLNNYDSRNLSLGENYGYLKYLDNGLFINGSGVLVRCASSCSDSAVYWKSVNEAITAKYPLAGVQIVVAAATDTEGFYTSPNVMILATKSKSDWVSRDNQKYPKTADQLWAVDLSDMRRLEKLDIPLNDFSEPKVNLELLKLFNRKSDNTIVGIGSWGLASGRDNTVMFSIDLDKITFD